MTIHTLHTARIMAVLTAALALATSAATAQNTTASTAPPFEIYEEDVVAFISEPDTHLLMGRAALARGDRTSAVESVDAAASFVSIEARRAQGPSKADLSEARTDLYELAARIRDGQIRTVKQFDAALQRTDRALARHHLERARAAWMRREPTVVGRELHGAARYTERLAEDLGKDADRGAHAVVRDTRIVTGKLIKGVGWTGEELGKGFDALGSTLDRLGARVEPRRR